MRTKICDYCDKHTATGSGAYPDMCEFCLEEFQRFKTRIHATCDNCLTPFSCQISKHCAKAQLELSL